MKLCGGGGGYVRGLPADFQCAPQGTLRDVGLGVVGAVGGRESEHERKFEKRPSGTSALAGCTRALLGLETSLAIGDPQTQVPRRLNQLRTCERFLSAACRPCRSPHSNT